MAIMDAKLVFDTDLDFIKNATTQVSENILDLGAPATAAGTQPNIGAGTPMYLHGIVTTACTNKSGITVRAAVQHCDTVGGTYADCVSGPVVLQTTGSAVGFDFLDGITLPKNVKRFVKIMWTTTGNGSSNAGTVTSFITLGGHDNS